MYTIISLTSLRRPFLETTTLKYNYKWSAWRGFAVYKSSLFYSIPIPTSKLVNPENLSSPVEDWVNNPVRSGLRSWQEQEKRSPKCRLGYRSIICSWKKKVIKKSSEKPCVLRQISRKWFKQQKFDLSWVHGMFECFSNMKHKKSVKLQQFRKLASIRRLRHRNSYYSI